MADIREGWLLLADISGYTRLLIGSDLAAGHAVIEDLLRTILASLAAPGSPISVLKLEGDAVLCRAERDALDGDGLLDRLDDVYHAFRMHLLTLEKQGRCECFACGSAAGTLDLKFVVHYGEHVVHRLAGTEDVSGPAVITVHRMLKNRVHEATGLDAYALWSDAARARCPAGTPFRDHVEAYEHLGEVRCGVLDLTRSFLKRANSARLAVQEADATHAYCLAVSPEVAWAWHVEPARRAEWDEALAVRQVPGERRQPGASGARGTAGCAVPVRILEWRPPVSVTFDVAAGGEDPAYRVTWSFAAEGEGGTRVHERVAVAGATATGWLGGWNARREQAVARLLARLATDGTRP